MELIKNFIFQIWEKIYLSKIQILHAVWGRKVYYCLNAFILFLKKEESVNEESTKEESIKEEVSGRKKKGVIEKNGKRFTYNDNAADSAAISLFPFKGSNDLLKEEH